MSNTIYVQSWLSFLQKTLEDTAPESAQKNINLKILRELEIPIPPIDLQNKFANIMHELQEFKNDNMKKFEYQNSLFESLLQKAFKGELNFKAIEPLA